MTEFLQNSEIEEEAGEYRNVEEKLGTCPRCLPLSRQNSIPKGLDVTDEEGDDVDKRYLCWMLKLNLRKIWMLAAELGQAPGL